MGPVLNISKSLLQKMSENLNYLIAEGSDPLREKVGVHLQLCHDEQGGGHQPGDEEAQQRKPDSLEILCSAAAG